MTMNATRTCPCGCGKRLGLYQGRQLLVCSTTWRVVPFAVRADLDVDGAPKSVVRRAVREVIQIAMRIRKARKT